MSDGPRQLAPVPCDQLRYACGLSQAALSLQQCCPLTTGGSYRSRTRVRLVSHQGQENLVRYSFCYHLELALSLWVTGVSNRDKTGIPLVLQ